MHPDDASDFGDDQLPALRAGVTELSWLLGRGYSHPSALVLVGDRHQLSRRQRKAVSRCAASVEDVARRTDSRQAAEDLRGRTLRIDGYNALLVVVSGVLGAPLLVGRDGVFRDVASLSRLKRNRYAIHVAIRWTAGALSELSLERAVFYLDRPLSGSGELRGELERFAEENELPWGARLHDDPDRLLKVSSEPVATADSAILDAGPRWFDLARFVLERRVREDDEKPWLVDLSRDA